MMDMVFSSFNTAARNYEDSVRYQFKEEKLHKTAFSIFKYYLLPRSINCLASQISRGSPACLRRIKVDVFSLGFSVSGR